MGLIKLISILFCVFFFAEGLLAYDVAGNTRRKQEQKDAKRWSLSEWLEQKQRNKLMDSWLMFNAPSPYEFFFGVDTSSLDHKETVNGGTDTSMSFRNYRGSVGAFVTAVGLYGEYETSNEAMKQWKALFMLRLIGSSDQSTQLTIHYGLMNQTLRGDSTQHQVGGGRFNFYIIKAFALTGLYEIILKGTSEQEIKSSGFRYEAGAHIEYGAIRFYGSWYSENLSIVMPTAIENKRVREGVLFGARIYF